MKAVEVLSVFAAIFLVNLSLGNGAPQWRPQGRFGKRFNTRTNDLITALTSGKKTRGIIRPIPGIRSKIYCGHFNGDISKFK